MSHRSLSPVFCLFAACAAVDPAPEVASLEGRPIEARLQVTPGLSPVLHELRGTQAPPAPRRLVRESERPPGPEGGFTVEARAYALDADLLRSCMTGWCDTTFALALPRAEALRLKDRVAVAVEAGRAVALVGAVHLLEEGEPGVHARIHQTAYVASFDVVSSSQAALADPRIEVAEEGIGWRVTPGSVAEEPDSLTLDVVFALSQFDHPFETRDVRTAGGAATMSVQVPRATTHELTTRAELARGEVLVVGGLALPVEGGERAVLVFLAPRYAEFAYGDESDTDSDTDEE